MVNGQKKQGQAYLRQQIIHDGVTVRICEISIEISRNCIFYPSTEYGIWSHNDRGMIVVCVPILTKPVTTLSNLLSCDYWDYMEDFD